MRQLLLALIVTACHCGTVTYTGEGVNNLWDNKANWEPPIVPTDDDDVVIPAGPTVILIGTQAGAHGLSMKVGAGVTLTINGSPVKIGTGGFVASGNANIQINSGISSFSVAPGGVATINDTAKVTWMSGSLSGAWVVTEKASLLIRSHGNALNFPAGGNITNLGTVLITDNSFVNMSSPLINMANLTINTVPNIASLMVRGNGTVTIADQANVKLFSAENIRCTGVIAVQPNGVVTISKLHISADGGLKFAEPCQAQITDITNQGFLQVNGEANKIDFYGATHLHTVTMKLGHVKFNSDATLSLLDSTNGTVTLGNNVTTGVLRSSGNCVWTGPGNLTATSQATVSGLVHISTSIFIGGTLDVQCKQVTLDGLLQLLPGAVMTISSGNSSWGPSNAQKPGIISNDGVIVLSRVNLVANSVAYKGNGDIQLVNARADLQAMKPTLQSLFLNTTDAFVQGESLQLSYKALLGPEKGSVLQFYIDDQYSQCTSPCGPSVAPFEYQTFRVAVRGNSSSHRL